MILGMSLSAFTTLHVVISLIGIFSGLVVAIGMLGAKRLPGWTAVFLVSTILTSVTGFFFPFTEILPSHIFGVVSLAVLALVLIALYVKHLAGAWRWIYVSGTVFALYLNSVVGIVQSFQKLAFLKPLAPTQAEAPFLVVQAILLVIFIALGVGASKKFHPSA